MGTQIRLRHGTAALWTSRNPVLAVGEPGFESDTNKLKLGDGTRAWTSLPYIIPVDVDPSSIVVGDPAGLTFGTVPNVVTGSGTMQAMVFPNDTAAFVFKTQGDAFPSMIFTSTGGDGIYFGNGTASAYSGANIWYSSGKMFLSGPTGVDISGNNGPVTVHTPGGTAVFNLDGTTDFPGPIKVSGSQVPGPPSQFLFYDPAGFDVASLVDAALPWVQQSGQNDEALFAELFDVGEFGLVAKKRMLASITINFYLLEKEAGKLVVLSLNFGRSYCQNVVIGDTTVLGLSNPHCSITSTSILDIGSFAGPVNLIAENLYSTTQTMNYSANLVVQLLEP